MTEKLRFDVKPKPLRVVPAPNIRVVPDGRKAMEGQEEGQGGGEGQGAGEGEGSGKGAAAGGGKGDVVSRAEYDRAISDLHKHKTTAKTLADQIKTANEEKLKNEKKWEELATARETEVKTTKEELDRFKNNYVTEKKYTALHAKALALGLREEAISDLESLDLEDIKIETTSTGKINVLGVDKFAERLKAQKPHWFSDKNTPRVNSKGQKITESNGTVTVEEVLKAQKEGQKSGDMKEYFGLLKKFQQQRTG